MPFTTLAAVRSPAPAFTIHWTTNTLIHHFEYLIPFFPKLHIFTSSTSVSVNSITARFRSNLGTLILIQGLSPYTIPVRRDSFVHRG